MIKGKFLALLAGAVVISTGAYAERLECNFKVNKNTGWVPEFLVLQGEGSNYIAADGYILRFHNGVKQIKLARDNSKKRIFKWSLQAVSGSAQKATMDYNLTINKGTSGKAFIAASPRDFLGNFSARGTCVAKPVDPNFAKQMKALAKERAKTN